MRRLLIIMVLAFFSSLAGLCPQKSKEIYILKGEIIKPYEKLWFAICQVESGGDPYAVGDKKLKEKSYGIAQIRQVRLDDYYEKTGIRYYPKEMYDTIKSKSVFLYYANKIGENDVEKIIRCWNGGERGDKKRSTLKYYQKVLIALKKQK